MHSSIYMLEKELIEHKVVTRLPLFLLACGVLIFVSLLMNSNLQSNFFYQVEYSGDISGFEQGFSASLDVFIASAAGFLSVILTSLYLPKTLRKERQEGSSMFWRSMPVSHAQTHSVKLAFGLLVIPAICSVLVFGADIMLWLLSITSDNQLTLLGEQHSIFSAVVNWLVFLLRMILVALALLPLACVALMVSQLVSSPILVMVLAAYTIKWLCVYLFGFHGVSEFFSAVYMLPIMVFSSNPFQGFIGAGFFNLIIYYVLGAIALTLSLKLSQTNEVSFKGFFAKG